MMSCFNQNRRVLNFHSQESGKVETPPSNFTENYENLARFSLEEQRFWPPY